MCVAPFVAWRPRSRPKRSTSTKGLFFLHFVHTLLPFTSRNQFLTEGSLSKNSKITSPSSPKRQPTFQRLAIVMHLTTSSLVNTGLIRLQIVPCSSSSIAEKVKGATCRSQGTKGTPSMVSRKVPDTKVRRVHFRRNSLCTATVALRFQRYYHLQFRPQKHHQPRKTYSSNRQTKGTTLQAWLVSSVSDSECDLTITSTCSQNAIASHTRATTTLKNDAGVVGSVTVHPRATRATIEKCIVQKKTQPQSQKISQTLVCSRRTFPSIDVFVNKHPTSTHFSIAAPAFAVVIAPIPESTHTGNLLPRNAMGFHPFFCTPLRFLGCPKVSFRSLAAVSGSLDPTIPTIGFAPSLLYPPSFSSWRGHSSNPQSFYCLLRSRVLVSLGGGVPRGGKNGSFRLLFLDHWLFHQVGPRSF